LEFWSMSKVYVCPFCGVEKPKKNQIDFHLKYGHAEIYHLLQEDVELQDLEAKMNELCKEKKLLEKEIGLMKSIIEERKKED
jgi:cell division protein FtsB